MGKVEENKQDKETRLLNTAFSLFTTKGIAKTSVADIVERAGMAKGTFYLYFRDKYDLQEKLISRKAEQVFQHAMEHSRYEDCDNFPDALIAIVDDILDQLQHNPTLLRFINKNISWSIFRRAMDLSKENYEVVLADILSKADGQVEDIPLLLYTIIELTGSTCFSIILDRDPVDLEQYKPYLYRVIRAMIREFQSN